MSSINHLETAVSSEYEVLLGATGVSWLEWDGMPYLVVSGAASGQMALYTFDGSELVLVDEIDLQTALGMQFHTDITVTGYDRSTETIYVLGGTSEAQINGITVNSAGFGTMTQSAASQGNVTVPHLSSTAFPTQDYLVHQTSEGGGLSVTAVSAAGDYATVSHLPDTADLPLGDISAITTVDMGSDSFVFVASAFDAGLAGFAIESDGSLTHTETVLPSDGSGFWLPQTMTSVTLDGVTYLAMASAGTSNIIIYEVGLDGGLTETDQIFDTTATRFQSVSSLVGFELEGRAYLVAAGSDDGFTILELGPYGQVAELETIEDGFDIALQNVSDLDALVTDGSALISVTSDTDHGISVFEFTAPESSPFDRETACEDYPDGELSEDQAPFDLGALEESAFLF